MNFLPSTSPHNRLPKKRYLETLNSRQILTFFNCQYLLQLVKKELSLFSQIISTEKISIFLRHIKFNIISYIKSCKNNP